MIGLDDVRYEREQGVEVKGAGDIALGSYERVFRVETRPYGDQAESRVLSCVEIFNDKKSRLSVLRLPSDYSRHISLSSEPQYQGCTIDLSNNPSSSVEEKMADIVRIVLEEHAKKHEPVFMGSPLAHAWQAISKRLREELKLNCATLGNTPPRAY